MITEDFVSFETAKLLRDKGFNGVCYFIYRYDGIQFYCATHRAQPTTNKNITEENEKNPKFKVHECTCPTQQMAMKWLREVHHIFIDIDWDARPEPKEFGNKPYFSLITNMNTNEFYSGKDLPGECASYEEACETAIKYCLENLI